MPRIEVKLRTIFVCFALLLFLSANLPAQGLPTARPEEVGMSSERLERLTSAMQ